MIHSKIGPSGQAISGKILLRIAVCPGTTGLVINVLHGYEVSVAAAVLFGLADLTKITLPIVSGVIGWTKQTRLTALVCVVVSLWCASNAYIDRAGSHQEVTQHAADQYAIAKEAVAKLEG